MSRLRLRRASTLSKLERRRLESYRKVLRREMVRVLTLPDAETRRERDAKVAMHAFWGTWTRHVQ